MYRCFSDGRLQVSILRAFLTKLKAYDLRTSTMSIMSPRLQAKPADFGSASAVRSQEPLELAGSPTEYFSDLDNLITNNSRPVQCACGDLCHVFGHMHASSFICNTSLCFYDGE
jgi:hypothetical protein